jgi:hypothetical protein
MAGAKGIRGFFKNKVWPVLKLLPYAILLGIFAAFGYDYLVSGSFKFYIYLVGVLLAIPGFYIIVILSRKVKSWEYKEELAEDQSSE